MAEPIKNELTMGVCAKGAAPQDANITDAARKYAQNICGAKVVDSFEVKVSDPGKRLIDDSNYYCRSVNVSFFCSEPQQVKGSNPSWEKGSPKQTEEKPAVHKKDYL